MQVAGVRLSCEGEKEFSASLRAATTAARQADMELKKLDASYGKGSQQVDYLEKRQAALNRRLTEQQKRTQTLRQVQASYQASGLADPVKMARLAEEIQRSELAEARLGRQIADTTAALKQQREAAEQAAKEHTKLAKAQKLMEKGGERLAQTGDRLTKGLTLPLAAGLTASAKAAMDFESAFMGVRKTVDASEEEYQQLEGTLWEMSQAMPQTAVELAELMGMAGQLGVGTKDLAKFTQVVAQLGMSTSLSSEEAASLLAQYANITQMPLDNMDRLGSVIVALGNNLATTEPAIAALAQRLASTGSMVGLTDAQIMGLSAAMASLGVEAEAGGTAMSKTLQLMNTAVLGNGKELKGFAKIAGVSAKEFAAQWKSSPVAALESFLTGLDRIKAAGGDAAGALKGAGLGDTRMVDTLLRMAGAGDLLARSLNLASDAWTRNTALQQEADAAGSTTANMLAKTRNSLVAAGASLGQSMLPFIAEAAGKVQELAAGFAALDTGTQGTIVRMAALAAGLGPVMSIGGRLVSTLGKLLPILTGPAGLAIAGVAGVVGIANALMDAYDHTEELDAALKAVDFEISPESQAAITEGINAGIAAADRTYEIYLEVKATTDRLREQVAEVFADGRVTWKEKNGLSKALGAEIDADLAAARQLLDKRRQQIREMLDGMVGEDGQPLYTEEEKNALAEKAVAEVSGAITELETLKGDLDKLLAEINKSGGTASEEQLAQMESIVARITQLKQQVAELQDDNLQHQEESYIAQKGGYGDEKTLGEAIGYALESHKNQRVELDKERDEARKQYNADIAAMEASGASEREKQARKKRWEEEDAAFDRREKRISADRDTMLSEAFGGIAKQHPEAAESLKQIGAIMAFQQMMKKETAPEHMPDMSRIFTPENLKSFSGGTFFEGVTAGELQSANPMVQHAAMKAMADQANAMLVDLMTNTDVSPFELGIAEMINQGVDLSSIDWSQVDGSLRDALITHLLSDDEGGGVEAMNSELMQTVVDAMQPAMDALSSPEVDGMGWTSAAAETIPAALAAGAVQSYAAAAQISGQISGDLSAAAVDGRAWTTAAAGIGGSITAGSGPALAAAWALRRQVEGILSGTNTTLTLPGTGGGGSGGGTGGRSGGGVTTTNDNSVNVYLQGARLDSPERAAGIAHEIAALNRRRMVGLGNA